MKKDGERHWKKQLAIDIVYYVGLVFLIKIPDMYKSWKRFKKDNSKKIGEKRF